MKTFFDVMREAQQSAFGAMMQKEFGLSAEQQAKAVEAMMPAFWLGLRKNAADPFGVAAFWQSVGTGPYRSYFDNPFAAMTPKARRSLAQRIVLPGRPPLPSIFSVCS